MKNTTQNIDLGYTSRYDEMATTSSPKGKKEKPKINYPSLVIVNKPDVSKNVKVGDTIKAEVTLIVTSIAQRDPKNMASYQDEHRVEFDVTGISIGADDEKNEVKESKEEKADFSKLGKGGKGVKKDD